MIGKWIIAGMMAFSFFAGTAHAAPENIRYGRVSFDLPPGYSHQFSLGSFRGNWVRLERMLDYNAWGKTGSLVNSGSYPAPFFYAELAHELSFPARVNFYSRVTAQDEGKYEEWAKFTIFAQVLLPDNHLLRVVRARTGKETASPDFLRAVESDPVTACRDVEEILKLYKNRAEPTGAPAYFLPAGYFDSPLTGFESVEFTLVNGTTRLVVNVESVGFAQPADMDRPLPTPLPPIKIEKALGRNARIVAGQSGEEIFTLESSRREFLNGRKKRFHAVFTSTGPVHKLTIDLESSPELSEGALAAWNRLLDGIIIRE